MTPDDLLTVPAGEEPLTAAHGLAERLEAAGHQPHVMEMIHGMSGLAMVHVHHDDADDEVVLVHTGDTESLRKDAFALQQMPTQGARWRLASAVDVPVDVAAVFDDSEVGQFTRRLAHADLPAVQTPLTNVSTLSDDLVRHVEEALEVKLDLDGGKDTLATLDGLVDRLRPEGIDPDAVLPFHAIAALGLLATETARRMGPPSRLGFADESFRAAENLAEVQGFPAVAFDSGHALQIARKVGERYVLGDDESVTELWERAGVPAVPKGEEAEAIRARLDASLGLAASLVHFVIIGLKEDGEAGSPVVWSLTDEGVSIARLMAADGNRALEMFEAMYQGDSKELQAMAFVADAYATNPATGDKRDALMVHVVSEGEELAVLTVPYVCADGEVTLPDQAQWLKGPMVSYPLERATSAFVPGLKEDGLSEVRGDYVAGSADAGEWEPGDAASTFDPDLFGDVPPEAVAIASFAPFAAFMMVAGADGDVDPREALTFMARIVAEEDPLLKALLHMGDVPLEARIAHLSENRELVQASLLAAMVVFQKAHGGGAARNALMSILESIAAADGNVDDAERYALDNLGKIFDGRLQDLQRRGGPRWFGIGILLVGLLVLFGGWYLLMG